MKKPKKPAGGGAPKKPPPQSGKAPGRGKGAGRKKAAAPKPPAHHHHHLQTVKQARHALHRAQVRARQARHAKHHPVRKLALGEGVACCSAEALAASLRLAGVPVGDDDVMALYERTASGPDAGASIWATLEAAAEFGLTTIAPFGYRRSLPSADGPGYRQLYDAVRASQQSSLILGVTLPGGLHALTLDPSGRVWSWGELYDLPELGPGRIDEAWLVDWGLEDRGQLGQVRVQDAAADVMLGDFP